jgi:spermidine synthase
MELWFKEYQSKHVKLSFRISKQVWSEESEFQHIEILESEEFGRVLILDGILMCTEKDEFIYHDMMIHVPLAVNPDIKKVLLIGGGDGGALRELTRYDSVERIDMVEIDEKVVEAAKKYLPTLATAYDDPRVKLIIADGLKFVRRKKDEYDLIIVDSTDPFGPGESLFTKEFYGNCFKALTCDGILINQHESPFYRQDADEAKLMQQRLRTIFPINKVFQAHIPTYPSGHWLFGFASKRFHPIDDLKADRWNALGLKTKYYNTDLHVGSFMLPNYVLELFGD